MFIISKLKEWSYWFTKLHRAYDYNISHQLLIKATQEAIEFYHNSMPNAIILYKHDKKTILDFELRRISTNGLYLEFGTYKAVWTNYIADKITPITIHGFDSFEGNPQAFHEVDVGYHTLHGILPKVRKNVILHKGLFSETIPKFAESNKEKIAYLNIDSDSYSSTKTIFDNLGDRLQDGTIIHFGEYLNRPRWKEYEHKAFTEFMNGQDYTFDYLAVDPVGRVSIKIEK